jgi:hypothetical protein
MKMGAGQFLRDFRRDYNLKKSLAHRKAVLQRKEKANEKRMKVHMEEISEDRSPGKRNSHARLLSLVNALTHKGLTRLYTKSELQRLCSGYDVHNLTRWNKEKLASELALAISRSENMPSHQVMSRYAVETVNEPGQPCRDIPMLKIRRI